MGSIVWLAKGSSYNLLNLLFFDRRRATWSRDIFQTLNPFLQKSPFPKDDRGPGGMKTLGYRGVAFPFSGTKNDADSQNHLSGVL
ncbi:hypothetical protein M1O16_04730 [Dehalococcoidia bacterium]|nr:hypothetical protein [Dehalococcoidia bacterium]